MPGYPKGPFQTLIDRHRTLRLAGLGTTLVGLVLAAWVGYEWFVRGIGHDVVSIAAGFLILIGIQLLIFMEMASMLLGLYHQQRGSSDDG